MRVKVGTEGGKALFWHQYKEPDRESLAVDLRLAVAGHDIYGLPNIEGWKRDPIHQENTGPNANNMTIAKTMVIATQVSSRFNLRR